MQFIPLCLGILSILSCLGKVVVDGDAGLIYQVNRLQTFFIGLGYQKLIITALASLFLIFVNKRRCFFRNQIWAWLAFRKPGHLRLLLLDSGFFFRVKDFRIFFQDTSVLHKIVKFWPVNCFSAAHFSDVFLHILRFEHDMRLKITPLHSVDFRDPLVQVLDCHLVPVIDTQLPQQHHHDLNVLLLPGLVSFLVGSVSSRINTVCLNHSDQLFSCLHISRCG